MDKDDDILAALPRPPLPAPARREAAIAEALRRFDGGSGAERPEARRGAGPAPWRTWFARPQSGALAGALLVAIVALPLAWTSLPDRSRDRPAESLDRQKATGPALADAAPASPDSASSPQTSPDVRNPQSAAPADVVPQRPGTEAGTAGPVLAAEADEPAAGRSEQAPAAADSDRDVVVTGSRIARPNLESSSPVTVIGGEEVARLGDRASARAAKAAPARRGDWNACTIDDPGRSLAGCRASGEIADGLARAWRGDWEGAARAFDSAIAAAPRSSAAHLNRGLVHRRNGELDRALADLDRAVRFSPRTARYYYQRSLLLRQRGDLRRAREDEARAARLDPRYAPLVSGP